MKLAIPTRDGAVDDHFGHCAYYTIVEINNGEIHSSERLDAPQGCGCKSNIASILQEMGVELMLAGNMGDGAKRVLESHAIKVVRGCKGPVDALLNTFMTSGVDDSGEACHHHEGEDHVCGNND